MATLTALIAEVQTRCDALTSGSTVSSVIDCAIAAKKVENAGGTLNRTTLDTQIQRVVSASNSSSAIEDLIALAATQSSTVVDSTPVGTFVQGLFSSSKYLPCQGGTYLKSAYPALDSTMLASLAQQVYTTSSTPMNSHALSSSIASTQYVPNIRYVDAGGGAVYVIGGSCSYSTNGTTDNYYRYPSGGGNTGWSFAYSPDGGTTLVDYSSRLTAVADTLAGGPTTDAYLYDLRVDDVLVNGTTVLIAGRYYRYSSGTYRYGIFYAVSRDSGATFTGTDVGSGTASYLTTPNRNTARFAAIGDSVVLVFRQGPSALNQAPIVSTDNFANVAYVTTGAAYSSTKTIVSVNQNGSRFNILFSDGTSAYTAGTDPSAANWTAVAAMPSVTTLFDGGVVGTKFIAVGLNGYVATCTTAGTWVYQSTATASMSTAALSSVAVIGTTIVFSVLAASTGSSAYYCTDATTLPAMSTLTADDNLTCPTLLSGVFVASGAFHFNMAEVAIVKSSTLAANSWVISQCVIPAYSSSSDGFQAATALVKYGYTYIQRGFNRYVSYDGLTFRPAPTVVTRGQGYITDVGSRLVAFDENQLLWQTTDGKTWNTTGITRPTIAAAASTGYFKNSSIDVTGTYVYITLLRNDGTAYVFVSTDACGNWTASSGFSGTALSDYNPINFTMGRRYYSFNSKVYAVYWHYNGQYGGVYVCVSSNGISFAPTQFVPSIGSSYGGIGFVEYQSNLYFCMGSGSSTVVRIGTSGVISRISNTSVPAVINTLINAAFAYKSDGTTLLWYVYSGGYIETYSGTSLTKSSRYKPTVPVNAYWYSSSSMKAITSGSTPTVPWQLQTMPDTADSFTLPTLSNTWLRALP